MLQHILAVSCEKGANVGDIPDIDEIRQGLGMPYDQPIAVVLKDLPTNSSGHKLQEELKRWLMEKYDVERFKKQSLEEQKNKEMQSLADPNKDDTSNVKPRRDYLRGTYLTGLRKIGVTFARLKELCGDPSSPYILSEKRELSLRTAPAEILADILLGDDAFEQIKVSGVARSVYIKRGIEHSKSLYPPNYVNDDFQRKTRRYAWVEKDWNVFEKIMESEGGLVGRSIKDQSNPVQITSDTSNTSSTKGGGLEDAFTVTNIASLKYNLKVSEKLRPMEMAHINQEEASDTQRAHPLTSTEKHLHGNEGYRFGRCDGVKLKIDLALIPTGLNDQLLINLHSWDAQTAKVDPTVGLTVYKFNNKKMTSSSDIRFDSKMQKKHSDDSAGKNRELVLLKFPREAIVEVRCHKRDKIEDAIALFMSINRQVPVVFEAHASPENEFYPEKKR